MLLFTCEFSIAQSTEGNSTKKAQTKAPTSIPDEWKQLPNTTIQTFVYGDFNLLESELKITKQQLYAVVKQRFGGVQIDGFNDLINDCSYFYFGSSAITLDSLPSGDETIARPPEMFYCRFIFSEADAAKRKVIIQSFLDLQQVENNEHFLVEDSSVFLLVSGEKKLWCSFDKEDSFVIGTTAFFAHQKKKFSKELKNMYAFRPSSCGFGMLIDLKGQSKSLQLLEMEVLGRNDLARFRLDGGTLDGIESQLIEMTKVAKANPELFSNQVRGVAGLAKETATATVSLLKALKVVRSEAGLELSIPASEKSSFGLFVQGLIGTSSSKEVVDQKLDSKEALELRAN